MQYASLRNPSAEALGSVILADRSRAVEEVLVDSKGWHRNGHILALATFISLVVSGVVSAQLVTIKELAEQVVQ